VNDVSEASNNVIVAIGMPYPPIELTAEVINEKDVHLAWTAPQGDKNRDRELLGYKIYRGFYMNKVKLNYIIDILLGICFVIVALSGIFLFLNSNQLIALIINKPFWLKMHIISSFGFMIFGLIHLLLHFNWLAVVTKTFFKKK
jgi:hypothetical protein